MTEFEQMKRLRLGRRNMAPTESFTQGTTGVYTIKEDPNVAFGTNNYVKTVTPFIIGKCYSKRI